MIFNYDNNKHFFFFIHSWLWELELTCFCSTLWLNSLKICWFLNFSTLYESIFDILYLYFLKFQHFSRENFRQTIFVVCYYRNMCVFFFFHFLRSFCIVCWNGWKAVVLHWNVTENFMNEFYVAPRVALLCDFFLCSISNCFCA